MTTKRTLEREDGGRRVLIDLGCGRGGWSKPFLARGWRCIGYDITDHGYPGELRLEDVRNLNGAQFRDAALIVASMPCDEFSRHRMPWTRPAPEPDLSLVEACFRIAREAGVPLILENVREAQRWLGKTRHWGPFYLWGDGVPALLPAVEYRPKESYSSTERARRAEIPDVLAEWIADIYSRQELVA